MILFWYFLAGFISGAAGVVLVLWWWIRTHAQCISKEEMMHKLAESKEDEQ